LKICGNEIEQTGGGGGGAMVKDYVNFRRKIIIVKNLKNELVS